VLRKFNFGSRHISKEQIPNILQTLSDKFFDLLESGIEPAAVSRKEFFADAIEFPLALSQFLEQRDRPMPLSDGTRKVNNLGLKLLPPVSHGGQV